MTIMPDRIRDAIDFCLVRGNVWQANAALIGLSAGQATAFKAAAASADTAYVARENAANAAKSATINQSGAVAAMRTSAADMIRSIKAFAEASANPSAVYAIAQIPPPATPSPRPAPGQPTDFKVSLNPGGSITLKWKCQNPPGSTGTVYHVYRRIGGVEGPATDLGTIGVREFTDDTVPSSAGGVGVVYVVQAQRADLVGPASLPMTVQFGIGGGGSIAITSAFTGAGPVPVKNAA
ncbi:MAG: hypothetical protein HEQ23_03330 [Tepidisphaera sp.]